MLVGEFKISIKGFISVLEEVIMQLLYIIF